MKKFFICLSLIVFSSCGLGYSADEIPKNSKCTTDGNMARCENPEVICYKLWGHDGISCKFKENK